MGGPSMKAFKIFKWALIQKRLRPTEECEYTYQRLIFSSKCHDLDSFVIYCLNTQGLEIQPI